MLLLAKADEDPDLHRMVIEIPEPLKVAELGDPKWEAILTAEDKRGLTPLIWLHVLPYGEVRLNMRVRLALGRGHAPTS
jgi:hypothetical protein